MRPKRRRLNHEDVAKQYINQKKDRQGFSVKEIPQKGRGVVTDSFFEKGEFLLQYSGKCLTATEGDQLENENSSGFRFFIKCKGKEYCIDATEEPTCGPKLGRLVNHGEKREVNVKLHIIQVSGEPALCLFASRNIERGEELLYNYGVGNLPWKNCTQTKQGRESPQPPHCVEGGVSSKVSRKSTDKGAAKKSPVNLPVEGHTDPVTDSSMASCNTKNFVDLAESASQASGADCSDQIPAVNLPVEGHTDPVTDSSMASCNTKNIIYLAENASQASGADCSYQIPAVNLPVEGHTDPVTDSSMASCNTKNIYLAENASQASGVNFISVAGLHPAIAEDEQSLPDTEIIGPSDTESTGGRFLGDSGAFESAETGSGSEDGNPESAQGDTGSMDSTESLDGDLESVEDCSQPSSDDSDVESYVPDSDDECSVHSDVIPLKRWARSVPINGQGRSPTQSCSTAEEKTSPSTRKNDSNSNEVASTSHSCTETESKVYVMTTHNTANGRCYDKPAYCFVCSRPQKKLNVHILQHSTTAQVAEWLAAKKGPEKDKLWIKMRNYGNHLHNYEVLSKGEGELIVVYRPQKCGDPNDYQPCLDCLGYLSRNEFYRHKCKLRREQDHEESEEQKRRHSLLRDARMLLPPPLGVRAGDVIHRLLNSLLCDDVSVCIKGDPMIVELARKFCFKHGHDKEQFKTLRNKLREIARLVLEYRQISGQHSATLADLIVPSRFELLLKSVRSVCGFDEETHQYTKPSLALKLGHSLKKAAMLVVSTALIEENKEKERQARDVITLLNENWDWEVSSHALRTLYEGKRNNPKLVPLTTDVVLLSKYLRGEAESSLADLKKAKAVEEIKKSWRNLAEITLTQILLFNRKRQGEVSKLTMEDYAKLKKGESHVLDMQILSKFEQNLAKVIWRVEIVGKRGRSVPVLITENVKCAVDELVKHRDAVGIEPQNLFVFAIPEGSTHYIRACDTLRKFSCACGAKKPELLRSTQLRKHIATMSQVMALQDNELDVLANFLGHDVRVHREYYRLPDATIQVAKVSKLLIALEGGSGDPGQVLQGKSLEQLDLQENEEVATEGDYEQEDSDQDDSIEQPVDDSDIKKGHSLNDAQQTEPMPKDRQKKTPWTTQEQAAVHRHLGQYIAASKLPGKSAIVNCMSLEPCLRNRRWTNVKDYIRNKICSIARKGQKNFVKK
ncbi:uncharacterized protein [Apostichopus japonicus]